MIGRTDSSKGHNGLQPNTMREGDTYFPSTETVHFNNSLTSDFRVICPSPDLNLLDLNYMPYRDSESSSKEEEINTDETIDHNNSDVGSLKSFNLMDKEKQTENTYPRSLPNEVWGSVQKPDEPRTANSLMHYPAFRLNSLYFDNFDQKEAQLNHERVFTTHELREDLGSNKEKCDSNDSNGNISKTSIVRCNCKKSKCLRLHCVCFGNLKECSDACNCLGCKNNAEFKEMRDFVVTKTREINPLAFTPKIKTFRGMSVNSRGCHCAKNNCLKKYCECFKSGAGCTKLCACVACKNSKETLNTLDMTDLKDKGYRRKHKIVISEPEFGKRDSRDEAGGASFVKHKKKRKTKTTK